MVLMEKSVLASEEEGWLQEYNKVKLHSCLIINSWWEQRALDDGYTDLSYVNIHYLSLH